MYKMDVALPMILILIIHFSGLVGFCSRGGGGVDVVSVVSVTLEGTSADAVRALKIWRLRVSRVKLFIPSRGSRNSKRSLGKAFVRISAS
ncbi:hypothetical protein Tco_1177515 [Tanacetum coccineum]